MWNGKVRWGFVIIRRFVGIIGGRSCLKVVNLVFSREDFNGMKIFILFFYCL